MVTKHKKCPECHGQKSENGFRAGVVNDVFVTERCGDCYTEFERPRFDGAAVYNLEREREDSARDMVQPYLADGKTPNHEFAHAYPDKAKHIYFTDEQLRDL